MIKVGITGGIGSGKSTVCKEWEKLGAIVFYADDVAKELMVTESSVRQKLTDAFGPQTYKADGSLNKDHLIDEAFKKGRVEELNAIVHPEVGRAFQKKSKEVAEEGKNLIVKEAALLLRKGRPDDLDVVVIVLSDRENRIDRVVHRDGVAHEEVQSRMEKQPEFDQLMHLADYTIDNNGSLEQLKIKAAELYQKVIQSH
ncbi:MAG: dephospho-CoA kinase [Balneolaceae bacterium]|nr:dephospho-CoA kinase [Balneolaceae bacterium]